jgi:hypothetical protein
VDLTSIDGIDVITEQTILSEVGSDMSGFPNENHFASWPGLTPSKDTSGGKVIGTGKRKVQNRVAMAFRMAATTLLNSKTYLGSRYRHLRKQLPSHANCDQGYGAIWQCWSTACLPTGKPGWTEAQQSTSNDAANGNWRA